MSPLAQAPAGWAVGVDLGGTKTEAILLDAAGAERWRHRIATPRAGGYAAMLQAIVALVGDARAQAAAAGASAPSIGFGTPGSLAADGRMKNCNTTCLNGQRLQDDLARLLGQPVAVANDANCLALSEATDGAGQGACVVFAAILGTGVGAGIAVQGRVLDGPNRLAGEWGHNPLPWATADDPQPACYCGQRGCVETLLSGPGLAAEHAARAGQASGAAGGVHATGAIVAARAGAGSEAGPGGEPLSAAQIAERAAAGDAACAATLARWQHRLARALAGVINLLDPDVVVLGGGLSRIASSYAVVPDLWGQWVFAGGVREAVRTALRPARHGDSSGVRGAAWLGRQLAGPSGLAMAPAGAR